ncbi:MAG TPA: hypothetical protein VFJ02_22765 [Vicinamibacterales bacterium]|nr:hypothetical protein [Vicinamibacterales bacterium]
MRAAGAKWSNSSTQSGCTIVKDTFDDGGDKGNIQNRWAWHAGI